MRAWISVLAVLATFQAIVQVASTDSAMGELARTSSNSSGSGGVKKSKHHRHRTSWSSPTLSFAAIVAAPVKPGFDLLNLNNIVLNSDNVKYPSHEEQKESSVEQQPQLQLLVPTNSSATAVSSSSSSSANSVVNTKSSSLDSNIISNHHHHSGSSNQITSGEGTKATKRRQRKRLGKGHRRRPKKIRMLANNSVHLKEQQQGDDVRLSSNELNGRHQDEEVATEEDEEPQQDAEEQDEPRERVKPDAEMLVTIEKNLLSLFGFKKRPKIDRSKVIIPEAMRRLYAETTGMELDLPDMPKPQVRAHHSANTVRSYTHEGESELDLINWLRTAIIPSQIWVICSFAWTRKTSFAFEQSRDASLSAHAEYSRVSRSSREIGVVWMARWLIDSKSMFMR